MGCGSGVLLDRLARAGFTELCGADPFLEADGTTPLGVPLMKRYLGEVPGEFDLIMFNHSLEHMPDPVETLKVARDKLADGGACLVRLPTTSSEAWPTYGADWIAIDAPRHIVVPSRPGMAAAAKTAGLSVEETYDDSSFIQFLASEAYRRDIPLNDPGLYGKMVKVFGPKSKSGIGNGEHRSSTDRAVATGRASSCGRTGRVELPDPIQTTLPDQG